MLRLVIAAALFMHHGAAMASKLFDIGDSVSTYSHTGWSGGQGYAALVAANAGFTEVNLAVSGATTAQMQSQWDSAVAQFQAGDAILVMPGENDIGVTFVASFRSTLDGQLAGAIAAGIPANRITLMTPFILNASSYLQASPVYLQAMREIAFSRGVKLVDVNAHFSELLLTKPNISAYYATNDNGHPSALGQAEIASLFEMPQNADSAAYHAGSLPPPMPVAAPKIVLTSLHQAVGESATPLSAQVAYSDMVGAPAVTWNVQDYMAPSGEVALMLDGSPFQCSSSVTITAVQFSRMMIAPVSHQHDIWINANNGSYNSGGSDFTVYPP